jgi:hypothetical protein
LGELGEHRVSSVMIASVMLEIGPCLAHPQGCSRLRPR